MAETIRNHENHEQQPASPESAHETHEKAHQRHEASPEHKLKQNIENIREKAEKAAIESDKTLAEAQPDESHAPKDSFVNKELKDMAYARTMNRVRQRLSPVSRGFSRLVHQPVVNSLSEGMAKTVARPSGLFGGGLVALIGTSIYYYISKHYGYDYNFFVFILLLAVGFIGGWSIEVLWRILHRRNQQDN